MELECFNFDTNLIVSATGTFTLSNLGMFGVDRFDAILPPGQVSDGFWDFWVLIQEMLWFISLAIWMFYFGG